ncbi:MAG: hypothetical protein FJZ43_05095 [Candidatus Staskawiczbacteria bacterium]|nr:hypothetical protein [Candidatus Staskawiczbacteria bacterium]
MATKNNNASVPQEYEIDSIESKFDSFIPSTYEEGWDSDGTPANFEFSDGVLLEYDEQVFDDEDDFVDCYEEMIGYRSNKTASAKKLYKEGQDSGYGFAPYLFTYTLDFSGHSELKKKKGEYLVVVKQLQVGGDGPIAGVVECSDDFDKKWLLKWIDNATDNNLMVERI